MIAQKKFRNDLNGLRAIAVIAVVFFHFGIPGFSGGFAGVDVFFVISGFLMTGIVFGGIDEQRFSLWQFYLARAKRIIPALLALCLTLLVCGWFFLTPSDYAFLGKHISASASFLSNFTYRHEISYFDASAHEKWLLHTWSLSVEWQFYLIYPLCILALRRYCNLNRARQMVFAAMVISFAAAIFSGFSKPDSAFYLIHARAWEMLAGGVVFLYPVRAKLRSRYGMEISGLLLISLSVFIFESGGIWPGWRTLVPVLGTSLVLSANRQNSPVTGNCILQFVGKISYSVYLWHWPLVVLFNYLGWTQDVRWILLGCTTSFILGYISYRWIEVPSRQLGLSAGNAGACFAVASVGMVLMGWGVFVSSGAAYEFRPMGSGPRVDFVNAYKTMHKSLGASYRYECDFYDADKNVNKITIDPSCDQGDGGGVLLWGDSHAQALSWGVRQHLLPSVEFYQVATSGCSPAVVFAGKAPTCDQSNKFALDVVSRKKPALIIIAQREHHEKTDWIAVADKLKELGAGKVVLVGPVPQWHPSLPEVIARRHWGDFQNGYVKDSSLDESILKTDVYMSRELARNNKFDYVSLIAHLCRHDGCLVKPPGKDKLLLVDYGHLSNVGSDFVVGEIISKQIKSFFNLRGSQ